MLTPNYVTINQNFSPIPQIYIPNTTILTKKKFWKISQFSRKLTLCAKLGQKWISCDFEVLPPDYVTINQNLSPIPQIYILNTTFLSKPKLSKISQFSRETYIVCKIGTKIVLLGFRSVTQSLCDNQSKFQSYSTSLHTKHYHSD